MPFDPSSARPIAFDPQSAKPSFDSQSASEAPTLEVMRDGINPNDLASLPPYPPVMEIGAPHQLTVPRFGAPSTMARGASDVLGGFAEWALNKPEEALASLTPLAPAIAARYAPEIATQFVTDTAAGVKGDREALGRALSMAALVGVPKAAVAARDSYMLSGASRATPERPVDVAAREQQPGAPELTDRDLRYLAGSRPPSIDEPPRIASATPPSAPGEVIAPSVMRTEEAQGKVERPPIGIDIVNEQGVRFGPEFWSFEPSPEARRAAPLTTAAFDASSATLASARTAGIEEVRTALTVAEAKPAAARQSAKEYFAEVKQARANARAEYETITPANDTPLGQNAAGEPLYQRTDGSVYRMRSDRPSRPNGYPDFGGDLAPVSPPIVGMGGATPAEFAPARAITSTKNAVVDSERAARGLPPAIEPARRAFGKAWDDAMLKIDSDPLAQDKLLASLRTTPRAVTDVENAMLLHRQVDLQNDYGKSARELAQAVDDGRFEDASIHKARLSELQDKLLDIYNVGKQVGTETGRGLNARKMLANEDFTLANMMVERRAVNDGRKLTPKEEMEVQQAHNEIAGAIGETRAKPGVEADFKLDKAKKKWNEKLAKDAEANASAPVQALHRVSGAMGDIRALRSALDVSALLRQGKLALASRPTSWAKAVAPSIRALASPLAHFKAEQALLARPNARSGLYARAGLEITEVAGKLSKQEEAFLTRGVAHKLPGVKASERAYVTFLNQLRANLFDTLQESLSRKGVPLTLGEAKVIANYANVMTGRGDLGKAAAAGELLSSVFWSPRWLASRFQMLLAQPLYYGVLSGKVGWREGARARRAVAKEYARIAIGLGTLYGLAYAAFAPDSSDAGPYSSDFAKLIQGKTRFDPWAGLQQTTVLLNREVGGKTTTLSGKTTPLRPAPYGKPTAVSTATQFLRQKLAPAPDAIVNAFQGENAVGEPVTFGSTLRDLLVPIAWQDVLSLMEDQGVERGVALQILQLMGEGISTYEPRQAK